MTDPLRTRSTRDGAPPAAEPGVLHGFFAASVAAHPHRVAVEVPEGPGRPRRSLTYAELDRRSDALARRLAPWVGPDAVVAVELPRDTPDLYVATLAILKAGAAFTAVERSFPDDHARFLVSDARAVAFLTDAAGRDRALRLGLPGDRILEVGSVEAAPTPSGGAPTPAWLTPSSLAYVVYTSGTTGRPKGVMIEHRGIANLVGSDVGYFGLGPDDRVAQGSSYAYDSAVEETWLALAVGAAVVVLDDETVRSGPDLAAWLAKERVSVFCPPPTLLRAMGCRDPQRALPALKLLYVGGEPLPDDLAAVWGRGRRLENGYGPTECTVTVVRAPIPPEGPVVIGFPVRGHEALVLDETQGPVADGEAGELCIAGVGLARGYLGRPDLTAEKFVEHPVHGRIYRTGDRARREPGGALVHLGRIDAQVKVRGHRIELGAVEARLVELPGVRAAAATVQDDDGRASLVAFVVPSDPAAPPVPADLRAALATLLPAPMVPSRIGLLDRLPTSVGGKLARAALPRLAPEASTRALVAPRDELEARVLAAFERVLGAKGRVSVEDDFFLDLAGDSLRAAEVVTSLRDDPATASLGVRDLYVARSAAALAARAKAARPAGPRPAATPGPGAVGGERAAETPRPLRATVVQVASLLAELAVRSAVLGALVFLGLPAMLRAFGLAGTLLLLPLATSALTLLWLPCAVLLTVVAKRTLIGAYRPAREPVWGSFHVRHWLVTQAARRIPWALLDETVFAGAVLRALGARIGRRVHLHQGVDVHRGGWDLLEIGDDAALGQEAAVRLVGFDDGHVVVGPVRIGRGAVLETRAGVDAGATVEDGACLTALSWLPAGETVPAGERWHGVPARRDGQPSTPPPTTYGRALPPVLHGLLLVFARVCLRAVVPLPVVAVTAGAAALAGVGAAEVIAWLAAPTWSTSGFLALSGLVVLGVPLGLLSEAWVLRAMGRVREGVVDRYSLAYLRALLKSDGVRVGGTWLAGTLFWPTWLRAAGMRIGRNAEISTIIDVVPELVTIGDDCFLADGIYLGGPLVVQGRVILAATSLGDRSFVGNHAVVPADERLPGGVLVGVCTVARGAELEESGATFGHPAFELPRRAEVVYDRRLTHDPGFLRWSSRFFFEAARFAVPMAALALGWGWFALLAHPAWPAAFPLGWALATLTVAAATCAGVVVAKWALIGRSRPGQRPLWSCWCSRWDFVYVLWEFLARPLLEHLEGTLLLPWYLRAMGVRVGRGVVLGAGFAQVVDPDMMVLEDGVTVEGYFQAHSFEDRVFKMDRVFVRRGATVAAGSVLFYGADIGEGARVAPHGVVMKNERLLPFGHYVGCPVVPVDLPSATPEVAAS
ncbi:MAG: amino acid adenylation domain-containing protein [Planctomycetia bacterium]|nr:amino acid adenylation domain-containing protein [Planctomycetia bacterium]